MPLTGHVREVRRRLTRSAIAIVACAIGGWFISDMVLAALRAPVADVAKQQHLLANLNFDNLTGAFDLKIQIAVTIGIVVASPVWLFQVWAFLVPGMTRRELKFAFGFFFTAIPLFIAGCCAGWYVVPHIVAVLLDFVTPGTSSLIQASDYFTFILKLVVAIGIAFVLPVFLVLLNFVGVLSARAILRSWRVALLVIVVFAAIATPSADVVSMFVLAIPMAALYFAAAGVSVLHERHQHKVAAGVFEPVPVLEESDV
jgi:sec-independent protein translocase protein TatC